MSVMVKPLKRPVIWLIGDESGGGTKTRYWASEEKYEGLPVHNAAGDEVISNVNRLRPLVFIDYVRVIINYPGDYIDHVNTRRFSGFRQHTTFYGSTKGHDDNHILNSDAEVRFTINGKIPRKNIGYLYGDSTTDIEGNKTDYDTIQQEAYFIDPSGNRHDLYIGRGFIFSKFDAISPEITLKARLFCNGKQSNIVIARFKVTSL